MSNASGKADVMRVATVIPRMGRGAARLATEGALALDGTRFDSTLLEEPQGGGVTAFRALTRSLREGQYDVVHTHGLWDTRSTLLGRAAAFKAGVPRVVHTWHGIPSAALLERAEARRTHSFLAVGSAVATGVVRQRLVQPGRLAVCWPTAPPGFSAGQWAQARRRLDLPLGVRLVGAVGRLTRQKGPDVFVRALARLPADVHGLWVGDGPWSERLDRLSTVLGVADRIRWLGARDDVPDLLPAFDAMAVPSRWDGIPDTLVEAIAAGIPLVASAVGSCPDLVVPGETGVLVPPGRPGELADALRWILDRPEKARTMADNARRRLLTSDRHTAPHLGTILATAYLEGPAGER